MDLKKRLIEITEAGDAPSQGELRVEGDIVHQYYNSVLNVIAKAKEENVIWVDAQEEVVSVLWDFARQNDDCPPEVKAMKCDEGTSVSLEAVEEALKRIMEIFGYDVVEIQ